MGNDDGCSSSLGSVKGCLDKGWKREFLYKIFNDLIKRDLEVIIFTLYLPYRVLCELLKNGHTEYSVCQFSHGSQSTL